MGTKGAPGRPSAVGLWLGSVLFGSASISMAEPELVDTPMAMLTSAKAAVDLRYRYEFVDSDALDKHAGASTLRSRLGLHSASYRGLSLMAEFDNVSGIGAERFNSTANGETQYPVVPDPEGTEINQAWLKYQRDALSGIYGRQRILHGNQRFVGGVGWRQNEQTYDGFRAQWSGSRLAADYSYVYNVNRIFGPDDTVQPADWSGENHFARLSLTVADGHTLTAFAYLLEIEPQSSFSSNQTVNNGSDSWGIEYAGQLGPVTARASYATQSEGGDSEIDYEVAYYFVEGAAQLGPVQALVGYEVLGAGDGVGFKTPLATLHKFQGWADLFLATPGDGIEDLYATVSGAVGPVKLAGTWHDFRAENSKADFGSEIDLAATWPINPQLSLQLKYANFTSDNSDRYASTQKAWMTVQFKL